MQNEIKALELAHEKAAEEYREAVEDCKRMMEDSISLGECPDGVFMRNLSHALLRRATRKRTEALNRVTQAVLRT